MSISISKHAIKRYRERLFDYRSSDEAIRQILCEIAQKGKKIRQQPGACDECHEVRHRGITIILLSRAAEQVVVTCLGEDSYRRWVKHKEFLSVFRMGGRSKAQPRERKLG